MPNKFHFGCNWFFMTCLLASCAGVRATATIPTIFPTSLPTSIPVTIPSACLSSARSAAWPEQATFIGWMAEAASSCMSSRSPREIIQILLSVWLSHFQSADISGQYRLERFAIYSIDNVQIRSFAPDGIPTGMSAEVVFAVLPAIPISSNPDLWWVAGAGAVNEYGWVEKQYDVWIDQKGDLYQMEVAPHGSHG